MIPADALICMKCRQFFDQKTGEKVKDLKHIKVIQTDGHDLCRPCSDEADAWDTTARV